MEMYGLNVRDIDWPDDFDDSILYDLDGKNIPIALSNGGKVTLLIAGTFWIGYPMDYPWYTKARGEEDVTRADAEEAIIYFLANYGFPESDVRNCIDYVSVEYYDDQD